MMKKCLITIIFLLICLDCINIRADYNNLKSTTSNTEKSEIKTVDRLKIITAICKVESRLTPNIINHKEQARGILQIRPTALAEANRLIGYNKYDTLDCYNIMKSIEMFIVIQNAYNPNWNYEAVARLWNGGPNWRNKESTKKYYEKVLAYL